MLASGVLIGRRMSFRNDKQFFVNGLLVTSWHMPNYKLETEIIRIIAESTISFLLFPIRSAARFANDKLGFHDDVARRVNTVLH